MSRHASSMYFQTFVVFISIYCLQYCLFTVKIEHLPVFEIAYELRADESKTYLLVAHNGIARVVRSYFYDMTNEEYAAFGIRNCEFVEYTFE